MFVRQISNIGSHDMTYAMHFSASNLLYLIVLKTPIFNPLTPKENFFSSIYTLVPIHLLSPHFEKWAYNTIRSIFKKLEMCQGFLIWTETWFWIDTSSFVMLLILESVCDCDFCTFNAWSTDLLTLDISNFVKILLIVLKTPPQFPA